MENYYYINNTSIKSSIPSDLFRLPVDAMAMSSKIYQSSLGSFSLHRHNTEERRCRIPTSIPCLLPKRNGREVAVLQKKNIAGTLLTASENPGNKVFDLTASNYRKTMLPEGYEFI